MAIKARCQYDERGVFESDLSFEGAVSLTKQSDAIDADINSLFARFERTGQLPNMIVKEASYGDFSSVPSYQEAVEIVRHADEQFINLDVSIRNRFDNDPAKFLAFATDPANIDELEKMKLLKPEIVAQRQAERKASEEAMVAAREAKNVADERALIEKIKLELGK